MVIFEDLIKKYHCEFSNAVRRNYARNCLWKQIPLLSKYHHLMLRSRQASRVLFRWYAYETRQRDFEQKKDKMIARNAMIEELLNVSKSAIYLRFVWKHLLHVRQDLMTPFLNSGECYRGVFYVPADVR